MKKNIILILVDALRADSLNCIGNDKNIAPTINKIAKNGVFFENCYACSNASDPALTSIMSGMHPRTHGIVHHSFEVNDSELQRFEKKNVRLLQEIFKEHGYATYGIDFLGRWHTRGYDYYPTLGIDRTKRKKLLNRFSKFFRTFGMAPYFKKLLSKKWFRRIFGGFQSYPSDKEATQTALDLIYQKNEPFFLFTHFWGVHKPFTCPDIEEKLSLECYENAISTVDQHIHQIISAAGENTIVVILGDHGESLGEHDIWFDHHGLYDPSIHVPLIFSGQEIPTGRRVKGLVSVTDIFKTILSIVGIEYLKNTDSLDLTPFFQDRNDNGSIRDFIFAEENYYQDNVCIRTDRYKFIKCTGRNVCELCQVAHGDALQLYDLKDDPEELNNIAEAKPEIVVSLEKKMETIISAG